MPKFPLALFSLCLAAASFAETTIVSPPKASPLETLAAREVRRYFYLRTGQLLPIVTTNRLPAGDTIVVARKDRPLVPASATAALAPQQYILKTSGGDRPPAGRTLLIAGGDDAGTLYGAYRFAERLGVRFYLHGDVVPDDQNPAGAPAPRRDRQAACSTFAASSPSTTSPKAPTGGTRTITCPTSPSCPRCA